MSVSVGSPEHYHNSPCLFVKDSACRGNLVRRFAPFHATLIAAMAQFTGAGVVAEAQDRPISQPDSIIMVDIKFREELEVRLEGGELRTNLGQSLDRVNELLSAHGSPEIKPLIVFPEEAVSDIEPCGSRLASWYRLYVEDALSVDSLVARLNVLAEVDTAYIAPAPVPLPMDPMLFGRRNSQMRDTRDGVF